MKRYAIHFPGTDYPSVELPEGEPLCLHLSAINSPLLFGCRAGLCGTCLIELIPVGDGDIPPPTPEEREALEVYAPEHGNARLACQVRVTGAMRIRRLA